MKLINGLSYNESLDLSMLVRLGDNTVVHYLIIVILGTL